MEKIEDDNEDPVVHTILDIYHNGKCFFCELKDLDDNELLIINADSIPKLLKLITRHVIAHQSHETTVEMIEKAEDDGILDYGIGNKKFDCEYYDSEADICKLLDTDDPVCFDGSGNCTHYLQKTQKETDKKKVIK